jgi:hypothetical protein
LSPTRQRHPGFRFAPLPGVAFDVLTGPVAASACRPIRDRAGAIPVAIEMTAAGELRNEIVGAPDSRSHAATRISRFQARALLRVEGRAPRARIRSRW